MDSTIVATSIPTIVRDLGGFSIFAWVFSAYVLAQAVTIPIYGKLADIYGRKPILTIGVLIFLGGSMLCGISWSIGALIAFRAIQGIGAGAVMPIVFTVVGDLYTAQERGRIQGWLSTAWGAAAILGPAIGGFFSDYVSWRAIFYINIPLGLVALLMVTSSFHEQVERRRHQVDVAGSALLALGAGLTIFGLLQAGVQWPWLSAPSFAVFGAAAVALVAFAWRESRAAEPTVPPWLVQSRVLMGATAASGIVGMLAIGLITYLPTFAQRVLGLGATASGFLLTTVSVSWSLASVISNRLYLTIGFRNNALVGGFLCLTAAILFSALPESPPAWTLVLCCAVMGLGMGSISTPLIIGVQSAVDWQRRGVTTGAITFAQQIGQAVGAALFTSVANSTLQQWFANAPPDLAGQLPSSLNEASRLLASEGREATGAVGRFIVEGLALATHQVFISLIFVAAVGLIVLLLTPIHFEVLVDDGNETGGRSS